MSSLVIICIKKICFKISREMFNEKHLKFVLKMMMILTIMMIADMKNS